RKRLTPAAKAAELKRNRDAKAAAARRVRGPPPFAPPVVSTPPVLACDRPKGRIDGHDRPHMLDHIHHPSVLHKCLSDFTNHMVNSVRSVSCAICDRNCKST
ncbi:unnamed protein product, partial [Ectocarpus sp. 12 AP-2014]